MDIHKNDVVSPGRDDLFVRLSKESWTYIKTVVDVLREPILILDKDLRVIAANNSYYQTFQVAQKDTEDKIVHELGNGQWNNPALLTLLKDIVSTNSFFKGFEVAYDFPSIGNRTMILNARQIHFKKGAIPDALPPSILLIMEDVTEMMLLAKNIASHANQIEVKLAKSAQQRDDYIRKLEEEINKLKDEP